MIACTGKVKFVLVTTDKIFEIVNQDFQDERAGEPVKVTGELQMDRTVISTVEISK